MKRFYKGLIAGLLLALAIGVGGCVQNPPSDEFKPFHDGFNEAMNAAQISQNIEVTSGALLVYSLEKSYTKGEGGYVVSGEEKRLNQVGADAPYTVTPVEGTVQKADTFTTAIRLAESDFEQYEIQDGKLAATLKEGRVDAVLGLESGHARMRDVRLEITLSERKVALFEVTFLSGEYSVSVSLSFVY